MALEITTIPVLTGDVAEKFEAQATKAYQNILERKKNNTPRRSSYEKGMNLVKEILSHSNLQESFTYYQQLLGKTYLYKLRSLEEDTIAAFTDTKSLIALRLMNQHDTEPRYKKGLLPKQKTLYFFATRRSEVLQGKTKLLVDELFAVLDNETLSIACHFLTEKVECSTLVSCLRSIDV